MDDMKNPANKRGIIYLRVSTARQASTGGETEGYSIPAQREACPRKAEELGAEVVQEYVDAGASARSIDRPALQQLLDRLNDERDIDYVIVHKVDRLARDRADDVKIGLAIHKAGAILVSASEQIDESPAGTLLHGIMAAIAEFYSKNLSHEAKKGLHEKVKRGGTPGYCPMGYINAIERIDGKEVKTKGQGVQTKHFWRRGWDSNPWQWNPRRRTADSDRPQISRKPKAPVRRLNASPA
jgi:DNA invertase Pin-like site-specific DNA recombinase